MGADAAPNVTEGHSRCLMFYAAVENLTGVDCILRYRGRVDSACRRYTSKCRPAHGGGALDGKPVTLVPFAASSRAVRFLPEAR